MGWRASSGASVPRATRRARVRRVDDVFVTRAASTPSSALPHRVVAPFFGRVSRVSTSLLTLGFSPFPQIGDYVDIKVNPSQQKGMPYLAYQGRTGIVWNVTPRAVGVEVNKQVRVQPRVSARSCGKISRRKHQQTGNAVLNPRCLLPFTDWWSRR